MLYFQDLILRGAVMMGGLSSCWFDHSLDHVQNKSDFTTRGRWLTPRADILVEGVGNVEHDSERLSLRHVPVERARQGSGE